MTPTAFRRTQSTWPSPSSSLYCPQRLGGRRAVALDAIARQAAELVPDGAVIQSGIGDTPAAVINTRLHRGLRVYSGIAGRRSTSNWPKAARSTWIGHVTGIAGAMERSRTGSASPDSNSGRSSKRTTLAEDGGASLFHLDRRRPGGRSRRQPRSRMAKRPAGQQRGRSARLSSRRPPHRSAAARSSRCRPPAARRASRIVPNLKAPSIPGELTDVIVTEHGAGPYARQSLAERAEALIAIAAPEHRAFLEAEYRRSPAFAKSPDSERFMAYPLGIT